MTSSHRHSSTEKAVIAGTIDNDLAALTARVAMLENAAKPTTVLFEDQFPGTTLDLAKWKPAYGPTEYGYGFNSDWRNSLAQCLVANGNLTIRAERRLASIQRPYASACIETIPVFTPPYTVQVSAKVPKGAGSFPAIWAIKPGPPATPPEVDFMEYLPGPGGNGPNMFTSTNWYSNNGVLTAQTDPATELPYIANTGTDWSLASHLFEGDVLADKIVFRVDGKQTGVLSGHSPQDPLTLLLTLAIGNESGAYHMDSTSPAIFDFVIDYVRVIRP